MIREMLDTYDKLQKLMESEVLTDESKALFEPLNSELFIDIKKSLACLLGIDMRIISGFGYATNNSFYIQIFKARIIFEFNGDRILNECRWLY